MRKAENASEERMIIPNLSWKKAETKRMPFSRKMIKTDFKNIPTMGYYTTIKKERISALPNELEQFKDKYHVTETFI